MPQHYVNTASAGGGDGTQNLTSGATAAYASLSSWEANVGATNTATDAYVVDCCGATLDSTAVVIDFATNITSGSITVKGNRSDPAGFYTGSQVISAEHYRIESTGIGVITCNENNTTIDGIQVIHSPISSNAGNAGINQLAEAFVVKNCRVFGSNAQVQIGVGRTGDLSQSSTFENNLVVGFMHGIYRTVAVHFSPTLTFRHNTVYGNNVVSGVGINYSRPGSGAPTINLYGNVCANNAGNDINNSGGTNGTLNADDNATEDSTGQITGITPSSVWTSPGTSVSSLFTVKDTNSAIYNVVNPTRVTTDITGFTRDGTNHDAGAFEFVPEAAKVYILLPEKWRRQPQYAIQLDSSNPLTAGLRVALTPGVDANHARGERPSTNTIPKRGSAYGLAFVPNGSGQFHISRNMGLTAEQAKTIVVVFNGDDAAQFGADYFVSCGTSFTNGHFYFWSSRSGGARSFTYSARGGGSLTVSGILCSGWNVAAAAVRNGDTASAIYLNGRSIVTGDPGPATADAAEVFRLGEFEGGFAGAIQMALVLVYTRQLRQGEVQALSANPWQVFRPLSSRIYVMGSNVSPMWLFIRRGWDRQPPR